MTESTGDEAAGLWARLRRRKVVQWGLAYCAGAWGLLQGVAYMCDTFGWPQQLQQTATVALSIGLPIALVVAWYHGDRGAQRVSGIEFSILIALLLVGGGLFAWLASSRQASTAADLASHPEAGQPSPDEPARGPSIAVLPFVNLSDDPANAYFADGLSEELLNALAKIPELRVAARTSSFYFKGKDVDIAAIAQRLKVEHVLEGSVRRAGDRVRITAQLVKADDGFHVWSETYDRKMDDVFAVQDEIAANVVGALKPQLLDIAPSTVRTNPEAYALYLNATQVLNEGTSASRVRAVELLQRVLEIAPGYAPAWAELARIYTVQANNEEVPLHSGYAQARAAAERAIAADPGYAAAHAAMAGIAMYYDWNFDKAKQELQAALALDPTDLHTLRRAATFLIATGRAERAVEIYKWRLERDPLNGEPHSSLGFALYWTGQYEAAEQSYRDALQLQPGAVSGHQMIGQTRLLRGDPEGALREAQLEPNPPNRLTALALALHGLGRTAESLEMSRTLAREHPEWVLNIASGYAYRGDVDAAFDVLERGLPTRDPGLIWLRIDPFLAPLRGDPRWPRLLARVGLSDADVAELALDVKLPDR